MKTSYKIALAAALAVLVVVVLVVAFSGGGDTPTPPTPGDQQVAAITPKTDDPAPVRSYPPPPAIKPEVDVRAVGPTRWGGPTDSGTGAGGSLADTPRPGRETSVGGSTGTAGGDIAAMDLTPERRDLEFTPPGSTGSTGTGDTPKADDYSSGPVVLDLTGDPLPTRGDLDTTPGTGSDLTAERGRTTPGGPFATGTDRDTPTGNEGTGSSTPGITRGSTPLDPVDTTDDTTDSTGTPAVHVVLAGETMSSIARDVLGDARYYVQIARENPLVDPTRLRPGQELRLPDPASLRERDTVAAPATADNAAEGEVYTVQPTDTLSGIAQQFYGDPSRWEEIYQANRTIIGDSPRGLRPNMRLTIPRDTGS